MCQRLNVTICSNTNAMFGNPERFSFFYGSKRTLLGEKQTVRINVRKSPECIVFVSHSLRINQAEGTSVLRNHSFNWQVSCECGTSAHGRKSNVPHKSYP